MAANQMSFSLRTSSQCRAVHLLGSWDGYQGQLPLSQDGRKPGAWHGTFRFQSATLKPGQRYWFYYIIDGHHVTHDPATPSTIEPTTRRKLNILDVPRPKGSSHACTKPTQHGASPRNTTRAPVHASAARVSRAGTRPSSLEIPHGRALSPSQIQSPKPIKPALRARAFATADYAHHPSLSGLQAKLAAARISPPASARASPSSSSGSDFDSDRSGSDIDSDAASLPSLTTASSRSGRSSRGSAPSPTSSVSSRGSALSPTSSFSSRGSACRCQRYGITRAGGRVKIDCGGARCNIKSLDATSSGESDCCSESSDDDFRVRARAAHRRGVVFRR